MKWFKNFETKSQLRDEVSRLKERLLNSKAEISELRTLLCTKSCNIETLRIVHEDYYKRDGLSMSIPTDYIKKEMLQEIARSLDNYVVWEESVNEYTGAPQIRGTLQVLNPTNSQSPSKDS